MDAPSHERLAAADERAESSSLLIVLNSHSESGLPVCLGILRARYCDPHWHFFSPFCNPFPAAGPAPAHARQVGQGWKKGDPQSITTWKDDLSLAADSETSAKSQDLLMICLQSWYILNSQNIIKKLQIIIYDIQRKNHIDQLQVGNFFIISRVEQGNNRGLLQAW